ncbi:hypothetical protein ACWD25_60135, partial [Streptomyces sp. NPDC002920]
PSVFQTYLPTRWAEVPVILFGFGAVMLARNPEGVIAMHARQLRDLSRWRQGRRDSVTEPTVTQGGLV